ncbi:hypothetical protein Emag_007601 [Eimeria magna]
MPTSNWAQLHVGLAGGVCAFLGDTVSLISFSSTCTGWREALRAALCCNCFWEALEAFSVNAARPRAHLDPMRTEPSNPGGLNSSRGCRREDSLCSSPGGDDPTRRGDDPLGNTQTESLSNLMLQPLLLLRRFNCLQRLNLEVSSQGLELAAFLGVVSPSLRKLSLTTKRGLTNAEVQQLCTQMPRLETLEIRIVGSGSAAAGGLIEERRATHTICRGDGGPWGPLRSIKRYLKLWTEVKHLSVTCEAASPPRGPQGKKGPSQLKLVSEPGTGKSKASWETSQTNKQRRWWDQGVGATPIRGLHAAVLRGAPLGGSLGAPIPDLPPLRLEALLG